jgi:2,5-diketo-D-gluconate reductase A
MQIDRDLVPRITLRGGSTIPQLGFGTITVQPNRHFSDANAEAPGRIVTQALAAGYRHIDTVQSYGTERGIGRAIAKRSIESSFFAFERGHRGRPAVLPGRPIQGRHRR